MTAAAVLAPRPARLPPRRSPPMRRPPPRSWGRASPPRYRRRSVHLELPLERWTWLYSQVLIFQSSKATITPQEKVTLTISTAQEIQSIQLQLLPLNRVTWSIAATSPFTSLIPLSCFSVSLYVCILQ